MIKYYKRLTENQGPRFTIGFIYLAVDSVIVGDDGRKINVAFKSTALWKEVRYNDWKYGPKNAYQEASADETLGKTGTIPDPACVDAKGGFSWVYLKRLSVPTNCRVSLNKGYKMKSYRNKRLVPEIIDDNGDPMCPSLNYKDPLSGLPIWEIITPVQYALLNSAEGVQRREQIQANRELGEKAMEKSADYVLRIKEFRENVVAAFNHDDVIDALATYGQSAVRIKMSELPDPFNPQLEKIDMNRTDEHAPVVITRPTLVNGQDIAKIPPNGLIEMITTEQKNAARLDATMVNSTYIDYQLSLYQENIKVLKEYLDAQTPAAAAEKEASPDA